MSLLDAAFERSTSSLSSGDTPEIPRHTRSVHVPAGTAAPGVFVGPDGEEVDFWLTLRTHSTRQEMAILNTTLDRGGRKMKAGAATNLVRDAMWLFHEGKPATDGGDDPGSELTRQKREWLWEALSQRGRNLVSDQYHRLTEVEVEDAEGNG